MNFPLWHKLFGKKKQYLGIDIGAGTVKIVELDTSAAGPSVQIMALAPVPQGVMQEGQIKNTDALSAIIREIVSKNGVSTQYCVSAVDGQQIFNRFLDFPVMTKEEVLEAVKWDAEKYIPYSPDACYIDAVILPNEAGAQTMKVLLIAAGKEIIDTHVEVLQKAELTPVAIDFGPLALGRVLLDKAMKGTTVVLDIGAGSAKMTFFKGQAIALSRTLPFDGNRITKLLQDELGLDWQEAETFKLRQHNLLGSTQVDGKLQHFHTMTVFLLNDMKREINRSLEYFQMQHRDEDIENVVFTGGCSLMHGLRDALLADLGLGGKQADLTEILDSSPSYDKKYLQSVSPLFATAVGLALWEKSKCTIR
jgi:type IV pilus assembly protein PilM